MAFPMAFKGAVGKGGAVAAKAEMPAKGKKKMGKKPMKKGFMAKKKPMGGADMGALSAFTRY